MKEYKYTTSKLLQLKDLREGQLRELYIDLT